MAALRGVVIGQTVDKGLGLFATRAMQRGTRILIEPPLFRKGRDFKESLLALSPTQRAIFDQLYSNQQKGGSKYISIYELNSWPCPDLGEPVVFALTARINHSCLPNAVQFYNHILGKNTVQLLVCFSKPP